MVVSASDTSHSAGRAVAGALAAAGAASRTLAIPIAATMRRKSDFSMMSIAFPSAVRIGRYRPQAERLLAASTAIRQSAASPFEQGIPV
jgi:hypothetical protein